MGDPLGYGVVREIRPLANNLKGAVFYDTVIELANQKDPNTAEWRLRPGMTASIDIVRREHKDVWKIPSPALNFKMDDAYFTPAVTMQPSWSSRCWNRRAMPRLGRTRRSKSWNAVAPPS